MAQFNMEPQGPDPKRLLLAIVLTSSVLMVYSYFFAPTPSPIVHKEQEPAVKQEIQKVASQEIKGFEPDSVHEHATKALPKEDFSFVVKEKSHEGLVQRTSYEATVSNQGGIMSVYALTDFSQDVVLFDKNKKASFLMGISLKNAQASLESASFLVIEKDERHVKLQHVTKDGLSIERDYRFLDQASIEENITFKNLNTMPIKVEPVFSAVKTDENAQEAGFLNPGVDGQYIAIKSQDKHQKHKYADLVDKPQSFTKPKYVAFDDQFFLSALMPRYENAIDHVEILVRQDKEQRKIAHIDLMLTPFVLMHNEEKSLSHQFFIGPKQIDLLASFAEPLDENIDFGWFGVLSRPMLWLLVQIFKVVQNYGLAIIIITIIIKLLTYPLTQKSFSSQQEMKKLQPKIKELQQKFGHDRTMLGQKQMELYRAHGVNPLAGCLPLLIQLPIWFAFFQMLRNSVELFDQPFYWWLTDLTRPDQYYVLPILMGVTMLIQQAFTPPPADQPQMKYVMWAMPIFLTFIMLNMPSGLSLYILTNNLLTIGQQLIIKRQAAKA